MNFSFSRLLHTLATLLVFAAAVHICIVLFMPHLSYGNAWSRLEQYVPVNKLELLTLSDSSPPPLPFMAPDVRYATCRYDLTEGPVQLHTPLPSDIWSIALYTRIGENFYLLSGQDVQSRAVNLLVVMDKNASSEKNDEPQDLNIGTREVYEVTVSSPDNTGIIVIRAPVPNSAYAGEIEALLKEAHCKQVDFAQQTPAQAAPKPQKSEPSETKPTAKRRNRRNRPRLDNQGAKPLFP